MEKFIDNSMVMVWLVSGIIVVLLSISLIVCRIFKGQNREDPVPPPSESNDDVQSEQDEEFSEDPTPEEDDECIYYPKGEQISDYAQYLMRNQLEGYSVYKISERWTSYSNPFSNKAEDALLFTVWKSDGKILLVYESKFKGNTTFMITVEESTYRESVHAIVEFFQSDKENKRSQFDQYMTDLRCYGIVKWDKRLHNNFESWKDYIRFSPRRMVQCFAKQ